MTGAVAPLVSAEVDLTDFPFMPVLIARLKQSRAWLLCKRRPELAFYMLNLWTAAWHARPAASLEMDDDVLADLAMCQPQAWKKVKADVLRGWVTCSDGRLYHPVVAEQAMVAWARKTAQRGRTEAARLARLAKRQSQSPTEGATDSVTDRVTEPVTGSATRSVTETVTMTATGSKGQGQGQGQYSVLTDGGPSPPPDPLAFRSVLDDAAAGVPVNASPGSGNTSASAPTTPDAAPTGPPDPSTAERDLFVRAKAVAGPTFGGQVPKLIRAKGGNLALARAAVELASTKHNPREYLARVIRGDDTGLPAGQLYDRSI